MEDNQKWTLSLAADSPGELLAQMSRLYVLSRAIHAIAELRISNCIADSPRPVAEIAATVEVRVDALSRTLRYLASYGIFEETSPGYFRATELSKVLRDDHPRSVRSTLAMVSTEWWNAAGHLSDVLHTGRSGTELAYGQPFFELLAAHPHLQRRFDEGMSNISRMDDSRLASAYDFPPDGLVVDLAGGTGNFLREILQRNANTRGLLFEQPHVLANSTLLDDLIQAGRARTVPGNLFEVIPGPAEVYILKGTLHEFRDEDVLTILTNCARAIRPTDRLLIIEQVIPPGNRPHPNKTLDMVMMLLLGGKQRTLEEWEHLLGRGGFLLHGVRSTPNSYLCIEAMLKPNDHR